MLISNLTGNMQLSQQRVDLERLMFRNPKDPFLFFKFGFIDFSSITELVIESIAKIAEIQIFR